MKPYGNFGRGVLCRKSEKNAHSEITTVLQSISKAINLSRESLIGNIVYEEHAHELFVLSFDMYLSNIY